MSDAWCDMVQCSPHYSHLCFWVRTGPSQLPLSSSGRFDSGSKQAVGDRSLAELGEAFTLHQAVGRKSSRERLSDTKRRDRTKNIRRTRRRVANQSHSGFSKLSRFRQKPGQPKGQSEKQQSVLPSPQIPLRQVQKLDQSNAVSAAFVKM